jgi:hypothetical protein
MNEVAECPRHSLLPLPRPDFTTARPRDPELPTKTSPSLYTTAVTALILALLSTPQAPAQSDTSALPDAPNKGDPIKPAGPFDKYIDPGQPAPRLGAGDKILLGMRDATSPVSVGAWVVIAGYEQAVNGKPHYGTNRVAFAQRFGASAARDTSEDIFGESILAPILHEDPRYYILGHGNSPVHRFTYAVTRALITRTNDGGRTVNFSQIGGNLAGAALTQAYYPPADKGVVKTIEIFGGSEAGSALGFVVSEFFSGLYEKVHFKVTSQ